MRNYFYVYSLGHQRHKDDDVMHPFVDLCPRPSFKRMLISRALSTPLCKNGRAGVTRMFERLAIIWFLVVVLYQKHMTQV